MNHWLNTSSPAPNNNAGFGPISDDAMNLLQPPTTINPAQFQNPAFFNGAPRTASPAFPNSMYQTNSVIPSKRTREDSLGASPRQASNAPPGSRSQTPGQGPYPGFNTQANGQPQFPNAPTPFQHLQNSSNATPSPTIQQGGFGSQGGAPRVSTASPNPFSPQHGGPQISPGQGDHGNRGGTPHDNAQNFMQAGQFGQNFNPQQFPPNVNMSGQMGMNPMNMAQQHMQQQGMNVAQRNYQLQMQAQARQLHAQAQARNPNGMTPNQQQGVPNQQMNPQQGNQIAKANSSGEEFVKGLNAFMAQQGRTVELYPTICGRPVPLLRMYMLVMKLGGSVRTTKMNQWIAVAQQCNVPPQQQMQAAQEMQHYWMSNLAPFEQAWFRQRQMMQNQAQNQAVSGQQNQEPNTPNHQRTQSDIMSMKLNGQMPGQPQPPSLNGFAPARDQHEPTPPGQHRSSLSRQLDPQQLNGIPLSSPQKRPQTAVVKTEPETEATMPAKKPIEEPFKPDIMAPGRNHGPINVDEMFLIGQQILEHKPVVPTIREMGIIDIHALTMAIKSGMHGETRVALDTLITLSTEPSLQLSLDKCEDLMETLIDYAQSQVEFLAENSVEVTDDMSLLSYEDVVRACRAEAEALQDVSPFGSLAYDLDRAADRLICVTTLIRNFSFYEANFGVLGQNEVLQLLTNVIQQLGTKEMPLRTNRNTLDFMKDVVIYLSNLSTSLNLPSKQEALCVLHFLLAFAPAPSPAVPNTEKVSFTMYNPNLHKYMPSAIDSLAKLLARDEPNRMYYKSIFAADANSIPPYELLTRTFGLAIASIPASGTGQIIKAIVEARKPFLLQGMLAAEILVSLAPGSEHPLARSWLESEDGFSGSLLRVVSVLSSTLTGSRPPPQAARNMPPQPEADANAYGAITTRAMAVLKTLVHKARLVDADGNIVLPAHVSLKRETLLGAMIQKDMDRVILKQLCSYAGLED